MVAENAETILIAKIMLQKLKLGPKFNLLLALIFIAGLALSGLALSHLLQRRAQAEVATRADVLIETMNGVRDYTTNHIQPILAPQLETSPVFIPETVPAFSATEVFQNLRKASDYRDFFYKEAAPNPTNLRDKADAFEAGLVDKFRSDPKLKELSGFRDLPGGRIFYIAHPLSVKKESCLRCHSTPDVAPKSQLKDYGSESGFGWKLNEIIAAQIVSVPAEEVLDNSHKLLTLIMGTLLAIFVPLMLVMNYMLRRSVIRPIRQIARTAEAVSMGEMDVEFEQQSQDEIGTLAEAFNRMKSSLEISMDMLKRKTP